MAQPTAQTDEEPSPGKPAQTTDPAALAALARYPLLDALRGRRSRRFGPGMAIGEGPFAYTSQHPPLPLSEAEAAALAFAAAGITGSALADLAYGPGQGGSMLAGLVGRTIPSPDAVNIVAAFLTSDAGTFLVRRPQDLPAGELPALIDLAQRGDLTELYRRTRVAVAEGRVAPPVNPPYNFTINRWSLYAQGGTYVLPVSELTTLYVNALLEAFGEESAFYILDERAGFQPAGVRPFGRRRGGHLQDDPKAGRLLTIQGLECAVAEAAAAEQGASVQNVALMAQAIGLGGFPNFAPHPSSWFRALGFRMGQLPASRYLGVGRLPSLALRLLRRDTAVPFPLGLERNGAVLLRPYCPPYHASMAAAVRALVEHKFGPQGVFRAGTTASAWRDPQGAATRIAAPSEAAIGATIAYCEYIYRRYGRFPAYVPPFRTVLGYQATHVDADFYDRFYRPEALTETQREHLARWHSAPRAP
jgi:hypothetical protein